ncbi:hypothetical protein POM88_050073 [Heracleum sosnowskyi]|uniref:HMA domain-containing protein n=1 Tax=Heracleum sosnowskyi TaxID=360622 RepID=A0AAD8GZC2_9APIA|nr:hypothetical protein POM88_050073 [Heracleum sosnowskyi]
MADIVQTYILKVNIGCCNACPRTLKKMLLNNKGVEKFDVDQEKNTVSVTGKVDLCQLIKDIKKKIKKNAEVIKKEKSDSGNKQRQTWQEQMAPPQHFSENMYSRYDIPAGIHDQNMYRPFMQVPLRDPRYQGHPTAPPWVFYPQLY